MQTRDEVEGLHNCREMEFLAIECQRVSRKLNISAAREQQGKGLGP